MAVKNAADQAKPVDLKFIADTFIRGDLVRQGTLMEGVPAEDAMDLVGAGKARLAKPGDSHAPVGDDDKAGE